MLLQTFHFLTLFVDRDSVNPSSFVLGNLDNLQIWEPFLVSSACSERIRWSSDQIIVNDFLKNLIIF